MSADPYLIKGMYSSEEGKGVEFETAKMSNGSILVIFTNEIPEGIGSLGLKSGVNFDGLLFYVTTDEFDTFKNTVVDKGVSWEVAKRAGGLVTIPGTWTKTSSGGRRRTSRKSRKSRKSLRRRR
jgi:hypothetical protein